MSNAPILLTGGTGQVGQAVLRHAEKRGLDIVAPDRAQMDLTNAQSIAEMVVSESWSAVINCAAYTAVDRAETDAELAEQVNAVAPAILAAETAKLDIPIIHVSTDYVFDGTKNAPYVEDDEVNPLGVYGRTKEMGENAVRTLNPRHAIIRTAWVVSAGGANFVNTMIRLASERPEISVVNDQIGCPSSATDIAQALLSVAEHPHAQHGTWHFVNGGEASWFDLSARIFANMTQRGLTTPDLHAIPTSQYPTPAERPRNSRLSTAAIQRDFGIIPRHWHDAIDAILAERFEN
ncbi:MAG: dTDP-4-dehydrorhamnose reductase [Sphingorhabdus sp.]|uniref:dTDP-4-dehydrorhamnose reductase n=1 Tax=Sphingorhabdus sp. TaxID=1902408 RepID=UPI0025F9DD85|nr:dTDP-4-dehydrorhamnose reductase [Sphingorhabdus sp.]MCO4093015.1 dTDP-4-dehydrorhamnose reductase [Sphingorhabdus sp.]